VSHSFSCSRFLVSIAAAGAGVAACSALSLVVGSRLTYNVSPSLPTGFYVLDDPQAPVSRGDVVQFKPPVSVAPLIAQRSYLPAGYSLLKRVVAFPGDVVCFERNRFTINGALFAPIPSQDSQGRPLTPFSFCGPLPPGFAAVATRFPMSFDSRFFGPIPIAHLRRAHPLFDRKD